MIEIAINYPVNPSNEKSSILRNFMFDLYFSVGDQLIDKKRRTKINVKLCCVQSYLHKLIHFKLIECFRVVDDDDDDAVGWLTRRIRLPCQEKGNDLKETRRVKYVNIAYWVKYVFIFKWPDDQIDLYKKYLVYCIAFKCTFVQSTYSFLCMKNACEKCAKRQWEFVDVGFWDMIWFLLINRLVKSLCAMLVCEFKKRTFILWFLFKEHNNAKSFSLDFTFLN